MVRSQDAGADLEGLLIQDDGVVESACLLVGSGEVVACGQGMGMVGSQEVARPSNGLSEGKCQLWHSKVGCIPYRRCE